MGILQDFLYVVLLIFLDLFLKFQLVKRNFRFLPNASPGLSTEHVLRTIHHCTFAPKYFLDDFLYPKSRERFSFRPSKNLMTIFSDRPQIMLLLIFFWQISYTTSPYFTYQLLSPKC